MTEIVFHFIQYGIKSPVVGVVRRFVCRKMSLRFALSVFDVISWRRLLTLIFRPSVSRSWSILVTLVVVMVWLRWKAHNWFDHDLLFYDEALFVTEHYSVVKPQFLWRTCLYAQIQIRVLTAPWQMFWEVPFCFDKVCAEMHHVVRTSDHDF